jgi:hypothetical protein
VSVEIICSFIITTIHWSYYQGRSSITKPSLFISMLS